MTSFHKRRVGRSSPENEAARKLVCCLILDGADDGGENGATNATADHLRDDATDTHTTTNIDRLARRLPTQSEGIG